MRDERIPVLYLAPWVDLGGTDKSTVDWFRWLDRDRFRPSLLTTQPSMNSRLRHVLPYADEVWPLPDLMHGDAIPRFVCDFGPSGTRTAAAGHATSSSAVESASCT